MLSSVALRAQVASVLDALSKAAVAEIWKLVEDGMVVLRLEMCQQDNEIQNLKSNVEMLHTELRAARGGALTRDTLTWRQPELQHQQHREAKGAPLVQNSTGDAPTSQENVNMDANEVLVKPEPMECNVEEVRGQGDRPGAESNVYDGTNAGQWRPQTKREHAGPDGLSPARHNSRSSLEASGLAAPGSSGSFPGFQTSVFSRGPPGSALHRNIYNTARRRTVKRLMFKKGHTCPFCGKCFGRAGDLERHKRIHTGEKPFRCDVCGRRFNQNSSLKEHTKIHRRSVPPTPVKVQASEEKPIPEVKPRVDVQPPEEEKSRTKTEDVSPKSKEAPPPPVQVKSEPAEEQIAPPTLRGASELQQQQQQQKREGAEENPGEKYAMFERDSQPWMSRLQQSNTDMCQADMFSSSAQSAPAFPAIAQLMAPPPPPAVEASCSSFSFAGKPYGDMKTGMMPQTPFGSLMEGARGMSEAALSHLQAKRGRPFQVIKAKKRFPCSYCGKIFDRSGHLERHLRIHTGEKPYGCHICGRCFNQKSSLKGHMWTHRKNENPDVPESQPLMFSLPENPPPETEPKPELVAFEEQLACDQALMVKVGSNGEEFHTQVRPGRPDVDVGARDQSELWNCGMEKGGGGGGEAMAHQTVCVLSYNAKYPCGAGAANEQQGYSSGSPANDLPFLSDGQNGGMMHGGDQYAAMTMHPRGSDMTLHNPHAAQDVVINDYRGSSDGSGEGAGFDFNMASQGNRGDDCGGGGEEARQSCFICSCCGRSFDNFTLFQQHQCKNIPE